jgi:putative membrane protein
MLKLLLKFVLTAVVVYLIATFVPGIHASSTQVILVVALVWSLITMFVRPVLKILTFPITLITLGLFSFVLNALLFGAVAYLVPGFSVDGILPALLGSIILSFATSFIQHRI